MNRWICALGLVGLLGGTVTAQKIGYVEDFVLNQDREAALKLLIPGTQEYYYYHCLHLQHTEQFDEVDQMLKAWIGRHKYTARVQQILNRQALLLYGKDSKRTLDRIKERLNLRFDHRREVVVNPNLPTQLDQKLISRETLTSFATSRHRNTQGFEDRALDWLAVRKLDAVRRRHLLERLQRPDINGLAKLAVADLAEKNSGGFGSLGIHWRLLPEQLEECLKLRTSLLNETKFVQAWMQKLTPAAHVDWQNDRKEHAAYLDRLWGFVSRLAPAHNSLKAHVLYHRLVFDRAGGEYDKDRFLTYLQLPRRTGYVNPKYLQRPEHARFPANLGSDFSAFTLHPAVGNDEPLVRSYLHHFFQDENDWKSYAKLIRDTYLKPQFAEAKIVNGLGDDEEWSSLLSPEQFRALKDRIDLEFSHTSKQVFGVVEPVSVDLAVKNVNSLIIKVFEINTRNFYRDHGREISTDVKLDGLVANIARTEEFDAPPLRRVTRHFEFPELDKPGVYVIDFIGNGRSSRVVVRKGKLRHLVRTSTAGHIFTVIDQNNRHLKDASIWLGGREYKADDDGRITTPFTSQPGSQPIVLNHNGFASLDQFSHEAENYRLDAGIHVDRESLLTRRKASVVLRPELTINGTPVTLSVLEDVRLVISSVDHDGVSSSKEVSDFKLFEDREAEYEFQVPPRLQSISFTLRARVQNISGNQKNELTTGRTFTLNQIERTEKIQEVHMACIDGSYVVELLGRTGEILPDRGVRVTLKHRDFRDTVSKHLESDANGRVMLGALNEIDWIEAESSQAKRRWTLPRDKHSQYQTVHGRAGKPIEIPYTGSLDEPQTSEFSLLELRGGTYVADEFQRLSIKDGMVRASKLKPGEYELWLKNENRRVHLRVIEGESRDGYILGQTRHLEVRDADPLQIASVSSDDEAVQIRLRNATKFTRVHVIATRYVPAFSPYASLSQVRDQEPTMRTAPTVRSLYIAGRKIGDELQYIINRKLAKKYPGNSVKRPSLLLNPWAVRSTSTGHQQAAEGDEFRAVKPESSSRSQRVESQGAGIGGTGEFSQLDFLNNGSAVLLNLVPDDDGSVSVSVDELGPHQHIHVLAVDPQQTACRIISRPEVQVQTNDLRLVRGLDAAKHFTQQKQTSVVEGGDKFVLEDISSSKFEAYDSLARVYSLFATLSNDAKLAEFAFVLNWPELDDKAKREKYSTHASHELNFFLYQKDRKFFDTVVRPYLANKQHKTFLDLWLLDADVTRFRQPWAYARLNTVERILLARRLKNETDQMRQFIGDQFALRRPDLDRMQFLYESALGGSVLETSDELGLNEQLKMLGDARQRLSRQMADSVADSLDMPTSNRSGQLGGGRGLGRFAAPSAGPADAEKAKTVAGFAGKSVASDKRRASGRLRDSGIPAPGEDTNSNGVFDGKERWKKSERDFFEDDLTRRNESRRLYEKLDETQEWAENNYYKVPIGLQIAQLVNVNAFWQDFAQHDLDEPFYSPNFAETAGNLTEMMFALSVLDLPFKAKKHETEFDKGRMQLAAGSPMVVFHQEIRAAQPIDDAPPILVSQNFFRHGDRHRIVDNEQVDKYVTDEFLTHVVYGCQVVVTNPTSTGQKLSLLLQVPRGAVPVLNTQYTKSVPIDLAAYSTQTQEYHFYFPAAGVFPHFPIHVAKNEELIAHAPASALKVVNEPSTIDRGSWDYISQHGNEAEVLDFLKTQNLFRVNLDRIAWRMADEGFFSKATKLLDRRHIYNNLLWSYSVQHDRAAEIKQFLRHADALIAQCGAALDSPLLVINPVERRSYEHLDYSPLVNARAHRLGSDRQILNDRLHQQYHRLLNILACQKKLDDEDRMAVTYYLLLQDRVEEAFTFFGQVDAEKLATRIQHDYFTAYLDLYVGDAARTKAIIRKYEDFPVDRWRKAFAAIGEQLNGVTPEVLAMINGTRPAEPDEQLVASTDAIAAVAVALANGDEEPPAPEADADTEEAPTDDIPDRDEQQTKLAKTEPTFDFKVEAKQIDLTFQNLGEVTVNFYEMDIELLFSTNPFVQRFAGAFSWIRPNETRQVKLPGDGADSLSIGIPEAFHSSNVLVEIVGAGQTKTQTYYAHSLNVQVVENYGQLVVKHAEGKQRPMPRVYVKVYAAMGDGSIRFYKDGYTDLRGRFDYSSLNTDELGNVRRFSVLILSENHGAIVREAAPPKQ